MKSFDNWYKEANKTKDDGFTNRDFYEAGQKSAQIEIDAMKEALLFQVQMLDEKQKRIDAAINYLDTCGSCCDVSILHLVQVLQGEKNENN